jgi:hypothetical protein
VDINLINFSIAYAHAQLPESLPRTHLKVPLAGFPLHIGDETGKKRKF